MEHVSEDGPNSLLSTVDFTVSRLPEVVRIEPASACNLKCIHRPTGVKRSKNRGVMSEETFGVFLRNLGELKPRVVVLYHGGEPFLNKNIFEWIRAIKSMGIGFVKTVTNGTLLTNDMLRKIVELGLDSIEFSLDGQSPEENNAIRVGSDYHKIVNIIKSLIRIKEERGSHTPAIFIANTQFAGPGKMFLTYEPSTPQFILDDFSGVYGGKVSFKNTFAIPWPGLDGVKHSKVELVESGRSSTILPDIHYCPHPVETITISWNGDIVACCYDITSEYPLGNIKESNLAEIWNNKNYRRLRRSLHTRQFLPLCQNCHVVKPYLFLGKRP